jgi:hypothetical protein
MPAVVLIGGRRGRLHCGAHGWCGHWRRKAHVLLIGRLRGGRGLDIQLTLQKRGAVLIKALDSRSAPNQRVQPHQLDVRNLVERVSLQIALGRAQGGSIVTQLLIERDKGSQRRCILLAKRFALGQQPVVIVARQEVAAIECHCRFEPVCTEGILMRLSVVLRLGQRLTKQADVKYKGRVRLPLNCRGITAEKVIGSGQALAQREQKVAQVAARLGFAGVRPEQKGDKAARLGCIAMQQQEGQQRLGPVAGQPRHGIAAKADGELTQQAHGKLWMLFLSLRLHPSAPGSHPGLPLARISNGPSPGRRPRDERSSQPALV